MEHRSFTEMHVSAELRGYNRLENNADGWPLSMTVASFVPLVQQATCSYDPATLLEFKPGGDIFEREEA